MSKPDAERAMEIYKNFTKQTDFVVAYLGTARSVEHQTRVEVPKLKHAPVNLGRQLEDYLKDPDFEINRRQYLAEQDGKKGRGGSSSASKAFATSSQAERPTPASSFPEPVAASSTNAKPVAAKGPDPDLIDFFESIEQNQQPMSTQPGNPQQQEYPQFNQGVPFQQPQQQQQQQQFPPNGFPQQQTGYQPPAQYHDPFAIQNSQAGQQQLVPNFTGAGFGGYTSQQSFQPGNLGVIPQDGIAHFQSPAPQQSAQMLSPQQTTNPFRLSMMANQPTGMPQQQQQYASPPAIAPSPITRQSTNPFAKSISPPTTQQQFSPPPTTEQQFQQPQQQQQQQAPAPLRPMTTGTNPFAKNIAQRPQTAGGLVPQPTGSTNPFRQSQFVNTSTGQAWQNHQTPMGGGLDSLETIPVFPRPANQQPWQAPQQ